ncbi:MAG: histidine phosphatase family protein [Thermoplasmataceae archaeon]|jgi:broad specificity phosphatase PhoE
MALVFLIRHGETDSNLKGIWQCGDEVPLNSHGIEQAREFGRNAAELEIGALYSSDMTRARQTAEEISGISGIPYRGRIFEFRERGCGDISGLDYYGIVEKYGIHLTSILSPDLDKIPGSEPLSEFKNRVISGLSELASVSGLEKVGVVTHGGVMAYVNSMILGKGIIERFPNCSYMIVKKENGSFVKVDQ